MSDISTTTAKHYFETHVTIEPIFDERLSEAAEIAKDHGFKIASLLMKKREEDTEERSKYDTFMTGHGKCLFSMRFDVTALVKTLKENGFKVWRYKIEDTIMDSRINDELGIL
jgi:hypothetical protein